MRKWKYRDSEWSVRDLSKATGLNTSTIRSRLTRGSTVEQAISAPLTTPQEKGKLGRRKSPWV